jgi:diguanylate cyclase (GGDEF)-like protein/PAS domain S-box-containing protein
VVYCSEVFIAVAREKPKFCVSGSIMKDEDKSKEQLINELAELRRRVAEFDLLVTKHEGLENALQEVEEKYHSLVESTEDSVYLVDRNCTYLFMNKRHLSMLGPSKEQCIGKAYGEFHSPEDTKEFSEKVKKVYETGKPEQQEHRDRKDRGYFLRTFSPVKSRDGKTVAISVVSKNITEFKRMEEELRTLSLTDELTGLYNRRGFITLSEQQLKMAKRLNSGIFMLYADMDHLKEINDTYGHREGDLAIIDAANILKATYRDSDIIARIGGDEFAVFPIGTTESGIDIMTDRLQQKLEIHNSKRIRRYQLSISVGTTYCDMECNYSLDELLDQADKLMYEQKRRKKKT